MGGFALTSAATDPRNLTPAGDPETWLTIPQIYHKVRAAGYHDINEIKRKANGYEVKGRTPKGQRVSLYLDPISGELLYTRTKGERLGRQ